MRHLRGLKPEPNPLKLREYLATGKPAVVRDLPATRPWADCADVAATPGEFTARVNERLAGGLPAGSNIEYANRNILADAISGRQRM